MHTHLITGPMFASKSHLLINTYMMKQEEGYHCLAYSLISDVIASRANEQTVPARHLHPHQSAASTEDALIEILVDLYHAQKEHPYIAVFIDEVQFAPDMFKTILRLMQELDIEIYLAGLEHTYLHERFPIMNDIIELSTTIEHLHSNCNECGEPAICNQRLLDGEPASTEGPLIALDAAHGGENEFTYEPRCLKCYEGPVA